MVKILWVDDEALDENGVISDKGKSFRDGAGYEDIEVNAFGHYDDALNELEIHPTQYTAIVLDVENDMAAEGDKKDGFMEALRKIDSFHGQRNQKEPYVFVFTGHDKYVRGDSKAFVKQDYASKNVYLKGSDREVLFSDIRKVADNSRLYQVFKNYEDVLGVAEKKLDIECQDFLKEIIFRLDYERRYKDVALLNSMRKILNYCINHVPFDYPEINSKGEPIETLKQKCTFIGNPRNSEIIPPYIQRHFHTLNEILNNGSHGNDEFISGNSNKYDKKRSVAVDVENGTAPYLLQTCMFELFNIILWINQDKFLLK